MNVEKMPVVGHSAHFETFIRARLLKAEIVRVFARPAAPDGLYFYRIF